jgi:hypothetical protein
VGLIVLRPEDQYLLDHINAEASLAAAFGAFIGGLFGATIGALVLLLLYV